MAPVGASQAGDYASKVAPYLPTGSLIAFQTVLHAILPTDGQNCLAGERWASAAWLAVVCLLCILLSWTDSFKRPGSEGRMVYMLVLPGNVVASFPKINPHERHRVRMWGLKDAVHGFLSAGTLATLALLSPPLSNCYYTLEPVLTRALPTMIVGVAVVVFGFFDNGRDGIGFNPFNGNSKASVEPSEESGHAKATPRASAGSSEQQEAPEGAAPKPDAKKKHSSPGLDGTVVPQAKSGKSGWVDQMVEKAGNGASKVAPFLPTGTLLTLKTVMQLILPAEAESFSSTERLLAIVWLSLMVGLCVLLTWTDSTKQTDEDGKEHVVYAFVTPIGHYPKDVPLTEDQKWGIRDLPDALLSACTLASLGLLDPPVALCFFGKINPWYSRAIPAGMVLLSLVFFKHVDNGRNGLGFNPFDPQEMAGEDEADTKTT